MIPGLGRFPGAENGNTLQYSCLGTSIEKAAWWATVQGVTKSQTRLSIHAHIRIAQLVFYIFLVDSPAWISKGKALFSLDSQTPHPILLKILLVYLLLKKKKKKKKRLHPEAL